MKFVADAMLGRLARRLRLLGVDVRYDAGADDNEVLRISLEEERTILTRDHGLASRPLAVQCLLIQSERIDEQVSQVLAACPDLRRAAPLTRCSVCNSCLRQAARESVRDLVPDQVFRSRQTFLRCEGCGRVYWKGSHTSRMAVSQGRNRNGPASR